MNEYMIIAMNDNGETFEVNLTFTTWEDACIMQETLENVCDAFSYLIYTMDEWLYEMENGRA